MIKLYGFNASLGSVYDEEKGLVSLTFEGLFVAEEVQVEQMRGKLLTFGDFFGIGRNISFTPQPGDIQVKSEDQDFISKLLDIVNDWDIRGTNPLHYVAEWKE